MLTRITVVLAALGLIWTACSPEPVFRLTHETGPTTFHMGVEYKSVEKEGIVVTMAYYRHMDDLFALDIEVFNKREHPVRVDPGRFGYTAYANHAKKGFSEVLTHRPALDPEVELLEIDKGISRHYASEKTNTALFLTLAGVAVAASVIASDADHGGDDGDDYEYDDYIYVDYGVHNHEYSNKVMNLEQRRDVWELETLRITDLQPGEYIRGLVFFTSKPDAAGYKIELPIENAVLESWYVQHKIKP